MATTPGKAELKVKDVKEDNLFTKVGFDGLGGTTRIRKNLREYKLQVYLLICIKVVLMIFILPIMFGSYRYC